MQGWYDNDSLDAAMAAARAERKPILVDFWDSTCLGCAKLVKVTYADAGVQKFLSDEFVSIKFNTSQTPEKFKALNGAGIHMWHPHLVVMDYRASEARRMVGHLSPSSFIAQLRIATGVIHLFHKRYDQAHTAFAAAAESSAPPEVIAESLYWKGVAAYRLRGTLSALKREWELLSERFPGSDWADRADCLDVEIPDEGFDADDPSTIRLTGTSAGSRH